MPAMKSNPKAKEVVEPVEEVVEPEKPIEQPVDPVEKIVEPTGTVTITTTGKEAVDPVEEVVEPEIEGEPNYTSETKRQVKLANGDIVSTAYYLKNKAKLEL